MAVTKKTDNNVEPLVTARRNVNETDTGGISMETQNTKKGAII